MSSSDLSSESPGDRSTLDPDYLPRMDDFSSSEEYRKTQSKFIEPTVDDGDLLDLYAGNTINP